MKKLLLVTSGIAFTIWFLYSAYLGLTQVETGESVASVDWLPDDATNVSYYRSCVATAYEFNIDEDGFRDWSHWEVDEIEEPVTITRYSYYAKPRPELSERPTDDEIINYERTMAKRSVTISDGIYYRHLQSNGGGVWVGYDRSTGRAYYMSSPR